MRVIEREKYFLILYIELLITRRPDLNGISGGIETLKRVKKSK